MSSFIRDTCTGCTICASICPTGSIFPVSEKFAIDTDSCEECKLCISVCPVDAIGTLKLPSSGSDSAA